MYKHVKPLRFGFIQVLGVSLCRILRSRRYKRNQVIEYRCRNNTNRNGDKKELLEHVLLLAILMNATKDKASAGGEGGNR